MWTNLFTMSKLTKKKCHVITGPREKMSSRTNLIQSMS
jgi:hypothetical protein